MLNLRFLKKPAQLEMHALGPDETWYERCYWLVLFVKELKAERKCLQAENAGLRDQVKSGEPLSYSDVEFLAMRHELNELHKAKAKLDNRVRRTLEVNRSLMDEVDDLRHGLMRAA